MKIAVVGAGAVGAFYGAKLQKAGLEVQYQSQALSKSKKLNIKSIWGDFTIPIQAFANTKDMNVADVIIIATKVTNPPEDTKNLIQLLQPLLHPKTIVLLLQNGINMEERIFKYIKNPILGGLAFTCINRIKPNLIHHLDYGLVKIGALKKEQSQLAREMVKLFEKSGIETTYAPDLRQARYEKLLWNVPFNSLSVLCFTDTQKLINNLETKDLAKKLMQETQKIAVYERKKITNKMIQEMINKTENMQPYKTSMLLDFEAKKKMEVESILGELLRMGQKYKISTPYLETIYKLLSFYNSRLN